jgi:hypothetical protein
MSLKLLALSAFLAAAVSMTGASNPKATGSASFLNPPDGQATITFNAIATKPTGLDAKGSILYTDPQIEYSADVKFLFVVNNEAWFAAQVTTVSGNTSICCAVGNWVLYKVTDNGEPGVGHDFVYGQDLGPIDSTTAAAIVFAETTPSGGPFVINGGNIQVH